MKLALPYLILAGMMLGHGPAVFADDEPTTPNPATPAAAVLPITTLWGGSYELPLQRDTTLEGTLGKQTNEVFQNNRRRILKTAAVFLDTFRPLLGAVAYFKKEKSPPNLGVDTSLPGAVPSVPLGGGKRLVQQALDRLDAALWMNAQVVATANEFGFSAETGLSGGAKVVHKGFYGIAGLGITLSVDPKNKVLVAEIFLDLESVREALPGFVGAGVFGTATFTAQKYLWEKKMAATKGQAFCVPGIVGCVTEDSLRAGLSKELGLGFPGTAAFLSDSLRVPLIRIGLSHKFPILLKFRTILNSQTVPYLAKSVASVGARAIASCGDAFSRLWAGK